MISINAKSHIETLLCWTGLYNGPKELQEKAWLIIFKSKHICGQYFPWVFTIVLLVLSCVFLDISWSCRYTSLLAVVVGFLLFLLTSFSDPGIVKAENVSRYMSAYPYDNIIYSEKECTTCKIPKWVPPPFFPLWEVRFLSEHFYFNLEWSFHVFGSGLLGPSTAAFVIAVLLASTIIVDGWLSLKFCLFYALILYAMCF